MKISINNLSTGEIDKAIKELQQYKRWLNARAKVLCERLAERGLLIASVYFGEAVYDGTNDVSVKLDDRGNKMAIVADGYTVLFIEFGTGVTFQTYHPKREELGVGDVGSYGYHLGLLNGGWRYPEEHGAGTNGEPDPDHPGYIHTYGNPANMSMYNTGKDLRREVEQIAREVFQN